VLHVKQAYTNKVIVYQQRQLIDLSLTVRFERARDLQAGVSQGR
jgi:hypothetical protein